jgi:hypothetical protein
MFIRNMENSETISVSGQLVKGWTLLDAEMFERGDFESEAEIDEQEQWFGLNVRVRPGGYFLRVDRGPRGSFLQPLWISQFWITGLFVPNIATRDSSKALPELASVQMREIYTGWIDDEENTRTSQAVELALARLREGRGVLLQEDVDVLLHGKFKDPMLGLLGVYALLAQSRAFLLTSLFKTVIGNLERLIPGHPDLLTLMHLGWQAGVFLESPQPVFFPPMLLEAYRALLACDADRPGTIAPGSPVEELAPHLVWQGSWTAFREPALETLAQSGHNLATEKVTRYLREIAAYTDQAAAAGFLRARNIAPISRETISRETLLPAATVQQVILAMTAAVNIVWPGSPVSGPEAPGLENDS